MKWQFNKRNTTYAVYACGIILFTILLINFIVNKESGAGLLSTVSDIIMPIFVGIILAYLLNPILRIFEGMFNRLFRGKAGKKALRALGLICTYVLFLGLITIFMYFLIPQLYNSLGEMAEQIMDVVNAIPAFIQNLIDTNESFADFYEMLLADFDLPSLIQDFSGSLAGNLNSLVNSSISLVTGIIAFIKNAFLGLFFSIYFLASKELLFMQIKRFFLAFFSFRSNVRLGHFMTTVDLKFGQFVRGKILDSTLVMIVVYFLTWIFGIPYYPLIALIIGVTDLIPVFGPFLGAIPSAGIILLAEEGGFRKALIFALLILVVQQIDGNVIAPQILGDRVGISGVWIMIAVVLMGGIFGIFGMFFGVPIFAVIYTLMSEAIQKRMEKKGLAEQFAADADNRPQPPKPNWFERIRRRLGQKIGERKKEEDGIRPEPAAGTPAAAEAKETTEKEENVPAQEPVQESAQESANPPSEGAESAT